MKNKHLSMILLIILIGLGYTSASSKKPHLPMWNNHGYTLTIDQTKIGKRHDTIIFRKKCVVFYTAVVMSNNSNNVLNYITYSCGWDDLFHADSKTIEICHTLCQSNYSVIQNLAPHKAVSFILPVIIKTGVANLKIRVGMNLFFDNLQNRQLFPLPVDKLDNVIWSNQVQLP